MERSDWVQVEGFPRVYFDTDIHQKIEANYDPFEIVALASYLTKHAGKSRHLKMYFDDLRVTDWPLTGRSVRGCKSQLLFHYNSETRLVFVISDVTECRKFDAPLIRKIRSVLRRIAEELSGLEIDIDDLG